IALVLGAGSTAQPASAAGTPQATAPLPAPAATPADTRIVFPHTVPQGSLVIGKVPSGSTVHYAGRNLRVTSYGTVAFGIARDQKAPVSVRVSAPDGRQQSVSITITARDFPIERVNGVPGKTVAPPPAIAERIAREQAAV